MLILFIVFYFINNFYNDYFDIFVFEIYKIRNFDR